MIRAGYAVITKSLGNNPANPDQAVNDFDRVAQNVSTGDLAQGVTQAFRSDQTPPFSQMVGNLFGNSDSGQRAGMLNQLLGGMAPGVLSSIAGGVLGNMFGSSGQSAPQITPDQASQMTPHQVQEIAQHAEQNIQALSIAWASFTPSIRNWSKDSAAPRWRLRLVTWRRECAAIDFLKQP